MVAQIHKDQKLIHVDLVYWVVGHHKTAHTAGIAAANVFTFTRGQQLSISAGGLLINSYSV